MTIKPSRPLLLAALAAITATGALDFVSGPAKSVRAETGNGAASCRDLWMQRNSIFAQAGYCFKSDDAKAVFGPGCFAPFGELSREQAATVDAIKAREAALSCSGTTAAAGPASRPVLYGHDPETDACSAMGKIVGLDPKGDGFLSVRSAPGGAEIDRLVNGQTFNICDGNEGDWLGVVYDAGGRSPESCNVNISLQKPMPYPGPCRSGWISRKYVQQISG